MRAYVALRRALVPLAQVERALPLTGRILDLCCGYGTLALLVAERGPARHVIGIDIDAGRIAVARRAAAGIPNVEFQVGDLLALPRQPVDAILLIDSLHYFRRDVQLQVLKSLRALLKAGDTLVLREVVRSMSPRFWWTWFHERVMTGAAFTQTADGTIEFLGLDDHLARLRQAGFRVERITAAPPWIPYADHLFIATAADPE